jgi:hypothetical protein
MILATFTPRFWRVSFGALFGALGPMRRTFYDRPGGVGVSRSSYGDVECASAVGRVREETLIVGGWLFGPR